MLSRLGNEAAAGHISAIAKHIW